MKSGWKKWQSRLARGLVTEAELEAEKLRRQHRHRRRSNVEVRNGMSASVLTAMGVRWRKSEQSGQLGNCVEVGALDDGGVAMCNSRHRGGPALIFTSDEMAAFVAGAKAGEFDDLLAV